MNFIFICSNIPPTTASGVFISQFIHYPEHVVPIINSLKKRLMQTRKLLNQGFFLMVLLKVITSKVLGSSSWL